MSELTATQCGCTNSCQGNSGCGSWIWIIIILFFLGGCCGNNNDCGSGCGNGFGLSNLFGGNGDCGNSSSCEWIIILLILFNCCGCND